MLSISHIDSGNYDAVGKALIEGGQQILDVVHRT
jgi:hypothetical protein